MKYLLILIPFLLVGCQRTLECRPYQDYEVVAANGYKYRNEIKFLYEQCLSEGTYEPKDCLKGAQRIYSAEPALLTSNEDLARAEDRLLKCGYLK